MFTVACPQTSIVSPTASRFPNGSRQFRAILSPAYAYTMYARITQVTPIRLVTTGGRDVLGLQPVEIAPGSPADLVAVRTTNRRTAIADAPADRIVLRGGEIVAWTRVESNVSHHLDGGAPWSTDNVVTFGSVPVESGHRTVESGADWEVRR